MWWLRYRLLNSVAFRPDDGTGAGAPPDDDERIPVDLEDDEEVTDPVDEADADAEGDETDDDADEEAEAGADDGGEAPAPSRGSRQHATLRADRRRLSEENARLTRELSEARQVPRQTQQFQESPEQEAARLALMSPEERISYTVDKSLRAHAARTDAITANLLDQSDRLSFETLQSRNPVARRLAPEVERQLANIRQQGQNLPRQTVFTYLVGERALAQMAKKKPQAQDRMRRQQAQPVRSQGDVVPDRRRRGGDIAALEKSLENVQI